MTIEKMKREIKFKKVVKWNWKGKSIFFIYTSIIFFSLGDFFALVNLFINDIVVKELAISLLFFSLCFIFSYIIFVRINAEVYWVRK